MTAPALVLCVWLLLSTIALVVALRDKVWAADTMTELELMSPDQRAYAMLMLIVAFVIAGPVILARVITSRF